MHMCGVCEMCVHVGQFMSYLYFVQTSGRAPNTGCTWVVATWHMALNGSVSLLECPTVHRGYGFLIGGADHVQEAPARASAYCEPTHRDHVRVLLST